MKGESKKSPTGPTERTPKPEYLIALATYLGSVGKVPFNFWWRESSWKGPWEGICSASILVRSCKCFVQTPSTTSIKRCCDFYLTIFFKIKGRNPTYPIIFYRHISGSRHAVEWLKSPGRSSPEVWLFSAWSKAVSLDARRDKGTSACAWTTAPRTARQSSGASWFRNSAKEVFNASWMEGLSWGWFVQPRQLQPWAT